MRPPGEEIMSTRDYSDETARLIDEEVERILRKQENRCRDLLTKRRLALDLVANALLEKESIPGSEVMRLLNLSQGNGTGAGAAASEQIEIAAASDLASSVRPV